MSKTIRWDKYLFSVLECKPFSLQDLELVWKWMVTIKFTKQERKAQSYWECRPYNIPDKNFNTEQCQLVIHRVMMPYILGQHRLYMNIFLWSLKSMSLSVSQTCAFMCPPVCFCVPTPVHLCILPHCVFLCPPWDTGTMGGVRVPTYRNRVVIFNFDLWWPLTASNDLGS